MAQNNPTDALLARNVQEIDERQKMLDGLVEAAQKENRDLDEKEMELVTRARDRIKVLSEQMEPLEESRRIAIDSQERVAAITRYKQEQEGNRPRQVEYRSTGEYVMDRWRAGLGQRESIERLETFHRAAAHQTTADNPGLLPEQILQPVLNFVDDARPLVTALGVRQLPSGSWKRPKVTQHTQIGEQEDEKDELVSRKMVIGTVAINAKTLGGYVNVSRQNIDWSQPSVMQLIIDDLAAQYALETEAAAVDELESEATEGPTLAGVTAEDIAGGLWEAAGAAFGAVKGAGNLIAVVGPDVLGMIGPLFPPVAPQDSQSTGFTAGNFGSGVMGQVGGIPVIMSAAVSAETMLIVSTAAAEVYEDRIGSLQVVEPSVLGVQVAYAGYFAVAAIEPGGIVKVEFPEVESR